MGFAHSAVGLCIHKELMGKRELNDNLITELQIDNKKQVEQGCVKRDNGD